MGNIAEGWTVGLGDLRGLLQPSSNIRGSLSLRFYEQEEEEAELIELIVTVQLLTMDEKTSVIIWVSTVPPGRSANRRTGPAART